MKTPGCRARLGYQDTTERTGQVPLTVFGCRNPRGDADAPVVVRVAMTLG